MRRFALTLFALSLLLIGALRTEAAEVRNWVVSWTGAAHGPYPSGNANAQPEMKFAFPNPDQGTVDHRAGYAAMGER